MIILSFLQEGSFNLITQKKTSELEQILFDMRSEATLRVVSEELSHSEQKISFPEYLLAKMQEKSLSPGRLWERSQIHRTYGYQILNGTKKPGRDKVIALCLALSLSLDDTQRALALAGAGALYARRTRDSLLIYAMQRNLSVLDTNLLLSGHSQEPLS